MPSSNPQTEAELQLLQFYQKVMGR